MKSITSVSQFLQAVHRNSRSREVSWYRGQLEEHELLPSLHRNSSITSYGKALEMERQLNREFKTLAPLYYSGNVESGLKGLMLMQHYRVPTRLLDWTRNPLVALFFALTSAQVTDYKKNTSIWILDPITWNTRALSHLPNAAKVLASDDAILKNYLSDDIDLPPAGKNSVTVRGFLDHSRIAAQQGEFVLFGDSGPRLESMADSARRLKMPKGTLVKLVVEQAKCDSMLADLLAMGITDDFIYPDLQGVVNYIRRGAGFSI